MRLMLTAMPAEFLHLQPLGGGLFVLGRGIVAVFAFLTLESDNLAWHN
jgi:hypothetical protein